MVLITATTEFQLTPDARKSPEYENFSFPLKLHIMLEDAERLGFEDVVRWQEGGKSFKVVDPDRYAVTIMRGYFNQTKYKSFQRQLNIYGFRRLHSGLNKGGYAHRCFIRGAPEFSNLIIRKSTHHKHPRRAVEEDADRPADVTSSAEINRPTESFQSEESEYELLEDVLLASQLFSFENGVSTEALAPAERHKRTATETSMGELLKLLGNNAENDDDDSDSGNVFPWKLHKMLEDAERENFKDIVSWVQDGTAFKVHDSDRFVAEIMSIYFDQTKYESFRRQLNLYGFTRVSRGQHRGVYSHPFFSKDSRTLCQKIVRRSAAKVA